MAKRNLAIKQNIETEKEPTPKPQIIKAEKAAENVSNELDKVIHERMRLGIISALAANKKIIVQRIEEPLKYN